MHFDVFFSISQTPTGGELPSEARMFRNFFAQVQAADRLGYGTAWIAESHLSSEVQKLGSDPVIPHWQGEVGLNADFFQLCHRVFAVTERIEVGAAIMNILCMGGPIAAAEKVAVFAALHGLDPEERRRVHVGFAAGRFDFMARATGIVPRDEVERIAWKALKGLLFKEASEIFLRLLRGDVIRSSDIASYELSRTSFRSDADWEAVQQAAMARDGLDEAPDRVPVARRWDFEPIKIVPQRWRRELLQLIVGSHEASTQELVNRILPVQVFNLSITQPAIIEDTHARMSEVFHPAGGPWRRSYMPRTTFVFLNEEPGLSPEQRSVAAQAEAREALGQYWKALQGTIDPRKVEQAADNALIGNAAEVAAQIRQRFHPEDRLMLWFDFFNHDSARVIRNMEAFWTQVRPLVARGASS